MASPDVAIVVAVEDSGTVSVVAESVSEVDTTKKNNWRTKKRGEI